MRAIILLSAMIGVMFAIPTLIILLFILPEYALQISLLAGCLAFILMSIFLATHGSTIDSSQRSGSPFSVR